MEVNEAIIDVEIGIAEFEDRWHEGSCQYWDALVVIEKLWSMSELKKARPKGVNLKKQWLF
ncbi:MAG: hypothetical protein HQK67_05455 [Desulfamplus sp.]|nr:hypothetical protein [Desulfamplus sp.]